MASAALASQGSAINDRPGRLRRDFTQRTKITNTSGIRDRARFLMYAVRAATSSAKPPRGRGRSNSGRAGDCLDDELDQVVHEARFRRLAFRQ